MSVTKQTLEHPVLTLMVFVLLGIMGIFVLQNVAMSLWPDIDYPVLSVSATYTNAGPETVEKSITKVLEGALVSLSNLKTMTSTSSEGRSRVNLEFNYGTNLDQAVNDVRDKLDRVTRSLPDDVTPSIFKMDADAMPILRIAVRGNRSNDDLKQIAEDTIVDVLEQADGVAEASVYGGRTKIVRVELSENRLAAYGLTIATVSSALSKQNLELGGGKINEGRRDFTIRTTGEFTSIEDINNTVIATVNGYDVKLSDLGTAFMGYADATNIVSINGEPGIYVSVTKQSGSNSITVANAVYEKLDELKDMLPTDVTLQIIRDDTDAIRDTLSTLLDSAWQGLLLAVLVLFVFLKSMKSTIIIAISIPLSIVITLLCMNFAGITLNMITMTGLILGVGMIVDASIVMIENIYVYRARGAKPKIAAVLGSSEMVMSVLSGNMTTICVFVPFLFFMRDLGRMGQMFKGIIFTVVIALVSSLFVAIFLVPVLAGHFLPLTNRKEKPLKSKFLIALYAAFDVPMNAITALYRRALKSALGHRKATTLICVCALAVAVAFVPTIRTQMMTGGHDDSVTVNVRLPIGTRLAETKAVLNQLEDIITHEVNGYKTLISTAGSGTSSYSGSIQIQLPDSDEQIDDDVTIQNKLRAHFGDFPADVRLSFRQGTARQMAGSDIELKVRSDSLDLALYVANQLESVMDDMDDIGEVTIDTEEGLPSVVIDIDRPRAYAFGLDVTTVAREINYAIDGVTATTYRKDGKEYDVKVMYQPADRQKVADLEQIFVRGMNGLVSVANFATVQKGLGPVTIRRDNQMRIVKVSADVLTNKDVRVVIDALKENV
ncbi:MAG: efflux RND transporter permease subunit, partial [Treponemataceae bacterium]|nr:efflux RND transporter permease subunit [Treponemataceae bacterium]